MHFSNCYSCYCCYFVSCCRWCDCCSHSTDCYGDYSACNMGCYSVIAGWACSINYYPAGALSVYSAATSHYCGAMSPPASTRTAAPVAVLSAATGADTACNCYAALPASPTTTFGNCRARPAGTAGKRLAAAVAGSADGELPAWAG